LVLIKFLPNSFHEQQIQPIARWTCHVYFSRPILKASLKIIMIFEYFHKGKDFEMALNSGAETLLIRG